ncbi:hypothetical protein [Caballeronia sp. BR00000012568055]|nr:hypothetical protein [Caballeronia sp. BR00000012568055]
MKLARIGMIMLALMAGLLAGCQTDGNGASGTSSTSGSSGGY